MVESGLDKEVEGAEDRARVGEPPSRVVLWVGVGFVLLFLAWTVRQTWRAVFGPF